MAKSRNSNQKAKAVKSKDALSTRGGKVSYRNRKRRDSTRTEEIEWWSIEILKTADGRSGDLVRRGPSALAVRASSPGSPLHGGSGNGNRVRGAAALAKAYMDDNPTCRLGSVEVILECYRMFLAVKKDLKDWDGMILSPSYLVDKMWELHSQLPDYGGDMMLLCGHAITRGSEGDASVLAAREKTTIEMIRNKFGGYNDAFWDNISHVWSLIPVRFVKTSTKAVHRFGCPRSNPLSEAMNEFAKTREGGDEGGDDGIDFEFFHERKRIDGSDTPATLGMSGRGGNVVEAIPRDRLKIILRDSKTGRERAYVAGRSDTLRRMMDGVAEKKGVDTSGLVFLCDGERVFGHEHPREFNLENYGVIEVVPVESYKCDRCVCCNPKLGPFGIR